MNDLIIELEIIRNQLFDFPSNSNGKTHTNLVLELTAAIEKLNSFTKEEENIPEVLAPEDLPDDEDL
ncbi:MAG TPA: hypothetical protein VNW06_04415 [Cytophagaceae bacterium]|jgi:hypothetical protein|nr:hypothetical protein [Cytophagaceae bacterium]